METLIYIWGGATILLISVILMDGWVNRTFSDDSKIKKFWKRHLIDEDPEN